MTDRSHGKMNMHPDMPRPNIPDEINHNTDWCGVDKSDLADKRFTFGHIPKEHWEQIFGKRDGRAS